MQVDSKKELEKLLKATCEAFIMAVTKLAVEPMLSFITKVTAVRVAASAVSAAAGRPLREQARNPRALLCRSCCQRWQARQACMHDGPCVLCAQRMRRMSAVPVRASGHHAKHQMPAIPQRRSAPTFSQDQIEKCVFER